MQPSAVDVEQVARRFLVGSRALVGIAARSLAEVDDVTLPQFRALVVLSSRPATTVSDLAAALDIHPTTATRLTDRLVRKGLVRRVEVAADRRITRLDLTAAGAGLVRQVTERRRRDITEIVGRMPRETWAAAVEGLESFAAAAGEPADVDLFAWDAPIV
jgi:DNA-binding MarR family transcriptional regulator